MTTTYALGVCFIALCVRWSISLNGYSGAGKPPMFGDYEAQRHWMEITFNLAPEQWYVNGSDNNLEYWGLDYPPLTAYHSWLCAYFANHLNSSWVDLHTSRGLESPDHKLFMRYTVLCADLLSFIPAVFAYFLCCWRGLKTQDKLACAFVSLLYPGLVLIDHGHFQYNCVSLGLTLWAVIGLCQGHDLLGAIAFVLALNYKQMELYHAMPFFCYLLGQCFWGTQNWLWKLMKIGVVVLGTFALCWLPFLEDADSVLSVVQRLFPFARGLYEDKVANVWCTLAVIFKLKQMFDVQMIIKICTAATLVAILPSSFHLFVRPTIGKFKMAMINVSLAFFLFSFQVHEKSILIPAMSVMFLLPGRPFVCLWFFMISTFSMLPLLIKDGLLLATVGSMGACYFGAGLSLGERQDAVTGSGERREDGRPGQIEIHMAPSIGCRVLFFLSMLGCVALTFASLTVAPPAHLPDLFPVLVSAYSCGHFLLFLFYFHWLQFTSADDLFAAMTTPNKEAVVKTKQGRDSAKSTQRRESPTAIKKSAQRHEGSKAAQKPSSKAHKKKTQ